MTHVRLPASAIQDIAKSLPDLPIFMVIYRAD